ncbi:gliding motility-associated C-terminal domain-containing protein [Formosa sp. S-31]|uniref:Ig-like domain-containing protein n=1 Tax=Formosa sp. S-31 TaxID=2790949 RepID=UPI003EB7CA76
MKPTNLPNKQYVFACLLFGFIFSIRSYAQITILAPTLDFTQACASADFNEYQVTFSFYPVQNLATDNQFIIELSDASGSFDTPTVLKSFTSVASPTKEKFAFPETVSGDNYKIRIRSTSPEFTSPESAAFSAYYAVHNQPFSINSYDSSVNLCQGETYTLQIDNNNTTASPVYYPDLTYIWYKNFNEIAGETSSALTVSETGSYYCVVDYGDCVMDSYSNIVDVSVITDITPVITSDNSSNALCAGNTVNLSCNINDTSYTYTWFKDDAAISNSNSPDLDVTTVGQYYVSINMGGNCDFISNKIDIEALDIDVSINNGESSILLIPGNTINLLTNTTANSPSYTWYKDDTLITGQSEADILINETGTYTVKVSQTSPCAIEKEAAITVVSPLYYELEIAADSNYDACNSTNTVLNIITFDAVTSEETINLIGSTQSYSFQWYKDNVAISGASDTSISIIDASENGAYTLDVSLTNDDTVISNTLNITLSTDVIEISNDKGLCNNQQVTLSANVSNTNYSYQWYKNDSSISGATASTYLTNEAGSYYLEVTSTGCTLNSNTINLIDGGINISSSTPESDIILPGDTKTLSIETDAINPAFSWYKDGEEITNANTNTYTATEIGTYNVLVTQTENCYSEAEKTFILSAPSDFSATVSTEDYKSCATDIITANLTSLTANADSGAINLLDGDLSNYTFQWYKDNESVVNATSTSIEVTDPANNGTYHVVVNVPDFGEITSNAIEIHLASVKTVTIATQDSFCNASSSVTLSTNIQNVNAVTFAWYKEGETTIMDTSSALTINEAGTYYVDVTDGDCVISSNYLEINAFDASLISTNYPENINLVIGTQLTIKADGAESYNWSYNNESISNSNEALVTQGGTYILTASLDGCETSKTFTVTEVENNAISIPNVVTLNNDGFNDTWALPNFYLNNPEIEVIIYHTDGSIAFKSANYMNNWPEPDYKFSSKSPVFYYVIYEQGKATKKGSITIIK